MLLSNYFCTLKGEKKEVENDEEKPDTDDVKTDKEEKEGEEKEEKKKKPTLKLASIANMTEEPRVRICIYIPYALQSAPKKRKNCRGFFYID